MKRPLIIAISFYIALALVIGLIVPKYKDLKAVQGKIAKANLELQYKHDYFSLLGSISEQFKQYEDQLSKIDSAIPAEMSALDVFNFISDASLQNGLILKEIMVEKSVSAKDSPRVKENYINFAVSGSYPSFKNFLSVLEKSARIIQIESISFRSSETGSAGKEMPTLFNVGIKVNFY